jgi:hypothetical protein
MESLNVDSRTGVGRNLTSQGGDLVPPRPTLAMTSSGAAVFISTAAPRDTSTAGDDVENEAAHENDRRLQNGIESR